MDKAIHVEVAPTEWARVFGGLDLNDDDEVRSALWDLENAIKLDPRLCRLEIHRAPLLEQARPGWRFQERMEWRRGLIGWRLGDLTPAEVEAVEGHEKDARAATGVHGLHDNTGE